MSRSVRTGDLVSVVGAIHLASALAFTETTRPATQATRPHVSSAPTMLRTTSRPGSPLWFGEIPGSSSGTDFKIQVTRRIANLQKGLEATCCGLLLPGWGAADPRRCEGDPRGFSS